MEDADKEIYKSGKGEFFEKKNNLCQNIQKE